MVYDSVQYESRSSREYALRDRKTDPFFHRLASRQDCERGNNQNLCQHINEVARLCPIMGRLAWGMEKIRLGYVEEPALSGILAGPEFKNNKQRLEQYPQQGLVSYKKISCKC